MDSERVKTLSRIAGIGLLAVFGLAFWTLVQSLQVLKVKHEEAPSTASSSAAPATDEGAMIARVLGPGAEVRLRQDIDADGTLEVLAALPDPAQPDRVSRAAVLQHADTGWRVLFDTQSRKSWTCVAQNCAPLVAASGVGADAGLADWLAAAGPYSLRSAGLGHLTLAPATAPAGKPAFELSVSWDGLRAAYFVALAGTPAARASAPAPPSPPASPLDRPGSATVR